MILLSLLIWPSIIYGILHKKLCFLYPEVNIIWHEITDLKNGQLLTAIDVVTAQNLKGNIIVHNCDTYFDSSSIDYETLLSNHYGVIPCFHGKGDSWSFVSLGTTDPANNVITEVREKVRISNHTSIGTYAFSSAQDMLQDALEYLSSVQPAEDEYFIAPFYNYLIQTKHYSIAYAEAKSPLLFGNPTELLNTFDLTHEELLSQNDWSGNQRRTLVVDIDQTLCIKNSDYKSAEPIDSVCERLRQESSSGAYIILFTSRNMRTFNGNIGLINKFTAPTLLNWLELHNIPFDEIYFGKPWGPKVNYIDDKMLSIDDFTSTHF